MNELLQRDDVRELTGETAVIVSSASALKIRTNVSYELAANELKRIKGAAARLEEVRKSITQPMDRAKQAVMDFFREPAKQLTDAEGVIKREMGVYLADVERKRKEQEALAEAAAAAERARLEAAATKAYQSGAMEEAQEITKQVCMVVAAPAVKEAPKVAGISPREVWSFQITDPALVPREYLVIDEVKIRKMVNIFKQDSSIPGVRAYSTTNIAASRG